MFRLAGFPEARVKNGRADILITTETGRKIIVENKTKSIGTEEQLKRYDGDKVVPLGLVAENFPELETGNVVTYREIVDALKSIRLDNEADLSVLVKHFIAFLEAALAPFEILEDFCTEKIGLDEAKKLQSELDPVALNENDQRFFQAAYFERLRRYFRHNRPELVLGDQSEDGEIRRYTTKWNIQKNMRGPAFMEALIYNGFIPGQIRLKDRWEPLRQGRNQLQIAPRLELLVGPQSFLIQNVVGVFKLGCWDNGVKRAFRESGIFRTSARARRNFHHRPLKVEDLKYAEMANVMLEEMGKLWEFDVNREKVCTPAS